MVHNKPFANYLLPLSKCSNENTFLVDHSLIFTSINRLTILDTYFFSDLYFEPGQKYVRVSGVSLTEAPLAIDLEWAHSSFLLNPLTWRLLSRPMIHINRVVAVHMETRER